MLKTLERNILQVKMQVICSRNTNDETPTTKLNLRVHGGPRFFFKVHICGRSLNAEMHLEKICCHETPFFYLQENRKISIFQQCNQFYLPDTVFYLII